MRRLTFSSRAISAIVFRCLKNSGKMFRSKKTPGWTGERVILVRSTAYSVLIQLLPAENFPTSQTISDIAQGSPCMRTAPSIINTFEFSL
jgi:hypothetical protein